MKRLILCLMALLLLFAACDKGCIIKRPKDVKPIDWENYNDVYTVFWNTYNTKVSNDMGKTIKICGWIFQGPTGYYQLDPANFRLCDKKEYIFDINPYKNGTGINVRTYTWSLDINDEDFRDSLKVKFATNDITKKCYITGVLSYFVTNKSCGEEVHPEILITNVNDIYFEN